MLSVYVVDDEIMAIEYFKMLLQGCKIPCTLVGFAINSWSALDDIMGHRPDVIFLISICLECQGLNWRKYCWRKCRI